MRLYSLYELTYRITRKIAALFHFFSTEQRLNTPNQVLRKSTIPQVLQAGFPVAFFFAGTKCLVLVLINQLFVRR